MNSILVDAQKCVGCNSCVRVCPIHDANVAQMDEQGRLIISVDEQKCIKCGACIKGCTHQARKYTDDTEQFMKDLKRGEKIAVIVAPAIKIAFDGYWRHILAWLRKMNADGIYDVSYGADICTWAHLKYLKNNPSAKIVTQPCAVIVNYAQKHKNELLKNLSPIHSPMLCMAVYLKKYLNYTGKIAAISPCIGKKDEFEQTGMIQYNVTMEYLKKYIRDNGIAINSANTHSDFEFDIEQGMEGSIYPKPGGLATNLKYHNPDVQVINVEGTERVYKELDLYVKESERNRPQILDVLNCELGCNEGPAIGQKYNFMQMNAIMHNVETHTHKKRTKQTKFGRDIQFNKFDKKLKLNDFIRIYKSEKKDGVAISRAEIQRGYQLLWKETEEEKRFDCHACGFDSCEEMARAVSLGLNIPDNCCQYMIARVKKEQERIYLVNQQVKDLTEELLNVVERLQERGEEVHEQAESIKEIGNRNKEDMNRITDFMLSLSELNKGILGAIEDINVNVGNYREMSASVEQIAQNINLLALNASIEAARAGEAGKGFAVVADNVRQLSDESKKSVSKAQENDDNIAKVIKDVNNTVQGFVENINQLNEIVNTTIEGVQDSSQRSQSINTSMNQVNQIIDRIKEMIDSTNRILE